jgi:hypothetical protein
MEEGGFVAEVDSGSGGDIVDGMGGPPSVFCVCKGELIDLRSGRSSNRGEVGEEGSFWVEGDFEEMGAWLHNPPTSDQGFS